MFLFSLEVTNYDFKKIYFCDDILAPQIFYFIFLYHCGASSKDAGKKLCAINKLENSVLIHSEIEKLLASKDKEI